MQQPAKVVVYEGDRRLGSLDLPMTRVAYAFDGYTEKQAKDLMTHLAQHLDACRGRLGRRRSRVLQTTHWRRYPMIAADPWSA
ncbi:MAG: hypothetical protein WBG92_25095 [Thiohalocapsa sp.]